MAIGNRVTEKDIRQWLDSNGWFGRSAKIESLELYAVRRPGWEQVFRFRLRAKKKQPAEVPDTDSEGTGTWATFSGALHDDERTKANAPSVWLFENEETLAAKLDDLAQDLIVLRSGKTAAGFVPLLAIIVLVATIGSLLKWFLAV